MVIVCVRGGQFTQYLKKGYNVVRRYQRGETPVYADDLFELLICCPTETQAKKQSKKFQGTIEIIKNKIDESRTKSS